MKLEAAARLNATEIQAEYKHPEQDTIIKKLESVLGSKVKTRKNDSVGYVIGWTTRDWSAMLQFKDPENPNAHNGATLWFVFQSRSAKTKPYSFSVNAKDDRSLFSEIKRKAKTTDIPEQLPFAKLPKDVQRVLTGLAHL